MENEQRVFRAYVDKPQSAAEASEAGETGSPVIGTSQGVDVLATSYIEAILKICDHYGCKESAIESIQCNSSYPVLLG